MQNLLSLTELQPLIIEWAKEKNILFPENSPKQRLKLIEECGELASAILKNDVKMQKDAIGDIFVVLTILSEQIGFQLVFDESEKNHNKYSDSENICELLFSACCDDFPNIDSCIYWLHTISFDCELCITECANIAWNEIKDRKGVTTNGTFIKEEK